LGGMNSEYYIKCFTILPKKIAGKWYWLKTIYKVYSIYEDVVGFSDCGITYKSFMGYVTKEEYFLRKL